MRTLLLSLALLTLYAGSFFISCTIVHADFTGYKTEIEQMQESCVSYDQVTSRFKNDEECLQRVADIQFQTNTLYLVMSGVLIGVFLGFILILNYLSKKSYFPLTSALFVLYPAVYVAIELLINHFLSTYELISKTTASVYVLTAISIMIFIAIKIDRSFKQKHKLIIGVISILILLPLFLFAFYTPFTITSSVSHQTFPF